jgi:hypothetical protein
MTSESGRPSTSSIARNGRNESTYDLPDVGDLRRRRSVGYNSVIHLLTAADRQAEHLWRSRLIQTKLPHVFDDPDDFDEVLARVHLLATGITPEITAARECAIDQDFTPARRLPFW